MVSRALGLAAQGVARSGQPQRGHDGRGVRTENALSSLAVLECQLGPQARFVIVRAVRSLCYRSSRSLKSASVPLVTAMLEPPERGHRDEALA